MPTKKKRASFSKTPHIAVAAQVSSLEDEPESSTPVVVSTPVAHSAPQDSVQAPPNETNQESNQDASIEDFLANDATESALSKKNKLLYHIGVVLTIVIVVVSCGIYIAFLSQRTKTTVKPAAVSTITPTPTAVPINKSSISVEVLNGSGVSGKAQKTADALKAKGYTIISTGNAKKIPVSTIQFGSSVSKEVKDLLLQDIREYNVSSVSSEPLTSSIAARLILGLQ